METQSHELLGGDRDLCLWPAGTRTGLRDSVIPGFLDEADYVCQKDSADGKGRGCLWRSGDSAVAGGGGMLGLLSSLGFLGVHLCQNSEGVR